MSSVRRIDDFVDGRVNVLDQISGPYLQLHR